MVPKAGARRLDGGRARRVETRRHTRHLAAARPGRAAVAGPAGCAVRAHRGHVRGTALLRTLLLDAGGESYLERRFLALVRRERLPRPTCQVMHKSGNQTIARVDFLFPGTTTADVIDECDYVATTLRSWLGPAPIAD